MIWKFFNTSWTKATIYSVQQSKVRSRTTSEANIIAVWRVENKWRVICVQCSAISERHCFECYQASPACLLRVVLTCVWSSGGISCVCPNRTLNRLALSVTTLTNPRYTGSRSLTTANIFADFCCGLYLWSVVAGHRIRTWQPSLVHAAKLDWMLPTLYVTVWTPSIKLQALMRFICKLFDIG